MTIASARSPNFSSAMSFCIARIACTVVGRRSRHRWRTIDLSTIVPERSFRCRRNAGGFRSPFFSVSRSLRVFASCEELSLPTSFSSDLRDLVWRHDNVFHFLCMRWVQRTMNVIELCCFRCHIRHLERSFQESNIASQSSGSTGINGGTRTLKSPTSSMIATLCRPLVIISLT